MGRATGISRAKRSFPRFDALREKTFFHLATLFHLINSITVYNRYFHTIFPNFNFKGKSVARITKCLVKNRNI